MSKVFDIDTSGSWIERSGELIVCRRCGAFHVYNKRQRMKYNDWYRRFKSYHRLCSEKNTSEDAARVALSTGSVTT